jgi:hypothetical protein
MGFFSNIKNRARGMANDLGPSNMPIQMGGGFDLGIRSNLGKRFPNVGRDMGPGNIPRRPSLDFLEGRGSGDMGMPGNKELLNPPPQQFRPDKLRPPLTNPNLPTLKPNDSRPALPVALAQTIQGRLDALNPGMPSMQEYLDQRGPGMPRLDRDFLYRGAGDSPGISIDPPRGMPTRPGMPQKPTGQTEEFLITDMLMRNPDGSPMMGSGPGMNFGDMFDRTTMRENMPPPQRLNPFPPSMGLNPPPGGFEGSPGGRFNPGNIGGRISDSLYSPLELAERKARARVEAGKQDLFQKNRKDRSKKQGGLGGLFRKLQEQIKNQQRPQQMPQQNLDFLSRLPQNMMPQVDFSNLPQMSGNPNIPAPDGYELRKDEKGMNYFREQLSPEDQAQNMLPRRLDVPFQDFNLQNMRPGFFGGRDVNIDDGGMVDFLNSNPQQVLFGIETRIGILQNQLQEAEANRDRESFDMIVQEINDADAQRIEIMNGMKPNVDRMIEAGRGRTLSNRDREILGETGRTISNMDRSYIDDILSSLEKKN